MSEAECQQAVAERDAEKRAWDERWKKKAMEREAADDAARARREAEEKEVLAAAVAAVEAAKSEGARRRKAGMGEGLPDGSFERVSGSAILVFFKFV